MYLDFLVKVPTVKGKITRRKKSNVVYIEYEYDRVYDPSRKYTFPKRVTIGKLSDTDPELMKPNQNFLKYFPDAELSESKNRTSRSSCLRVGAYFVLRKLIEECSLKDILGKYLIISTNYAPINFWTFFNVSISKSGLMVHVSHFILGIKYVKEGKFIFNKHGSLSFNHSIYLSRS